MGLMCGHMKTIKFRCDAELASWLDEKAEQEDRSRESMIRVILHEAKYAEEARQLEATA